MGLNCLSAMQWNTGGRKENKLVNRNFESACVHFKAQNAPAVTTKIITQMQEAYGLTSQQLLHDITMPRLKLQLTRKQGTLKPLYFYIATWDFMHLSRTSVGASVK